MRVYFRKGIFFFLGYAALFLLLCPIMWLFGPFPYYRLFVTQSLVNSSRADMAYTLMGEEKITEVLSMTSLRQTDIEPVIMDKSASFADSENGITIESIEGRHFKGKVMIVEDSSLVRVAVTAKLGSSGQRLAEMMKAQKAVAGINGGGFSDPNAIDNGAWPEGITIVGGDVVYDTSEGAECDLVGFTREGALVLEKMNASAALARGYEYAVSFSPFLLVDGAPQIVADGGWGVAPRTGIGQRADGAVILVVIDGRNAGWSMGATLRDLMNVFLEYHAVNAANLDGGSSTEMVYGGYTVNRLWNILGSRSLATSFIVLPKAAE